MLLIFDRIIQKIIRAYRKAVFKRKIACPHNNFTLVGRVDAINTNIKLGNNVTIYQDVFFWGNGPIVIGDNVTIGNGTVIASLSPEGISIGENTIFAGQCCIIDCDHSYDLGTLIMDQEQKKGPIHIGKDVWLASGVTVLRDSNIGDGAVLGAKSLVKGEVPSNSISVGIPSKVIKYRSK